MTLRHATGRLRHEAGYTMIEMLVALIILVTGGLATVGAMASSSHVSLTTQREQAAWTAAEQAMEKLRAMPYANLALSSTPAHATDTNSNPSNPDYWVSSSTGNLIIPNSFNNESSGTLSGVSSSGETMVTTATACTTGTAVCATTTVSTGGYTVTVYQFVTYINDTCLYNSIELCSSSGQDAKRLVVAAVVPSEHNTGVQKPVWLSTIVENPTA